MRPRSPAQAAALSQGYGAGSGATVRAGRVTVSGAGADSGAGSDAALAVLVLSCCSAVRMYVQRASVAAGATRAADISSDSTDSDVGAGAVWGCNWGFDSPKATSEVSASMFVSGTCSAAAATSALGARSMPELTAASGVDAVGAAACAGACAGDADADAVAVAEARLGRGGGGCCACSCSMDGDWTVTPLLAGMAALTLVLLALLLSDDRRDCDGGGNRDGDCACRPAAVPATTGGASAVPAAAVPVPVAVVEGASAVDGAGDGD